jgi:PAS domain S-box-containing protein
MMAEWWGYSKPDVIGRRLEEVMRPGGFDESIAFIRRAIDSREVVTHERTIPDRAGRPHVFRQSFAAHMDEAGVVRGVAGVVVDVTDERSTQEALRESERQTAVAEERNRLARELHDAATQTIYSAVLIAEALPQVYARNPEEGARNLTKLQQLVRGGLAEMRTLLFELRPWTLESVQLARLLEYLRASLTGRTRVDVEWDVEVAAEPPVETKTAVYRIVQEAFNNIVKHARATNVRVSLRCDETAGCLAVTDDGRGFDPAAVTGESMGLSIMRERAEDIGGSLGVESAPGCGTAVQLTWAMTEASRD